MTLSMTYIALYLTSETNILLTTLSNLKEYFVRKAIATSIIAHCYYTTLSYHILLLSIVRYSGIYRHAAGPCGKARMRGKTNSQLETTLVTLVDNASLIWSQVIGDRPSQRSVQSSISASIKVTNIYKNVGSSIDHDKRTDQTGDKVHHSRNQYHVHDKNTG